MGASWQWDAQHYSHCGQWRGRYRPPDRGTRLFQAHGTYICRRRMMSNIAIRAANLAKQYRIGSGNKRHDTIRDHLTHGVRSLFGAGDGQKRESTIWSLKDVSFEIHDGEVVGIIGRNGAGKSTLLRILSRITEPTSGYATIRGRVGCLLEVGTGFHAELTGR